MNFNILDRNELYETLKPNDNLQIKKNVIGEFTYYSIDNFLKNPLDTIAIFKNWPALDGHVYTPGARQNFTPMDLVPIMKTYQHMLTQLGFTTDVTKSITSTIIAWKNMQVWKNSWMPHHDRDRVICNIWLCDYEGGTAFYKYKERYNNEDLILPKGYTNLNKKIFVPWQNFEGNEDWELYHIIPSIFNTLVLYEGKNFHGTYASFDERYRYSIQTFVPYYGEIT